MEQQVQVHDREVDPDALYRIIDRRRDVRGQFTGAPIAESTLLRILSAGHAAPSVGLSQPWDFIVIRDQPTRELFWRHVQSERAAFASQLTAGQAEQFQSIKIDGILESSVSLVVTYDPERGAPAVLGRHAIADTGAFSVCLAIQNLWLAACSEGLGVGWVSFYREPFLRDLLEIPRPVRPLAWLCLGPVTHFETTPDLERHGWRSRRPLTEAIHIDRW